jgi:hypothetical protein
VIRNNPRYQLTGSVGKIKTAKITEITNNVFQIVSDVLKSRFIF